MRFLLVALAFQVAVPLFAQSPEENAAAIINYGEKQLRGESTQAAILMVIKKPDYTRRLKLRSWTVGDKRAMVEILEPAKEEGISSLRVTDQMWNYLPKTDQVVRVPTSLMLQSWMGSDFTNDDLMKSSSLVRDYLHRVVRIANLQGQKAVLIECLPKPNAPVVWGKVLYWARLSDRLPLMESYYDEKGVWVRTMRFGQFKKMDDRVIPTMVTVQVAEDPAQSTTIFYAKILYDRVIEENTFSQELLRRTVQTGRDLATGWSLKLMHPRAVAQQSTGKRKRPRHASIANRG